MSLSQVGACPKCGAPIYAPMIWHGITPPPNQYTCNCFERNREYISTTTDYETSNILSYRYYPDTDTTNSK